MTGAVLSAGHLLIYIGLNINMWRVTRPAQTNTPYGCVTAAVLHRSGGPVSMLAVAWSTKGAACSRCASEFGVIRWLLAIAQHEIPFYEGKHSLPTVADANRLHEVDKEHDVPAAKFYVVVQLLKEVYQRFGMPALIINHQVRLFAFASHCQSISQAPCIVIVPSEHGKKLSGGGSNQC